MQMYLWAGKPSHQVVVGASTYSASGAAFGPALTSTGKTGTLTIASPADGCTAISTTLTGRIAIIDRGTCDFTVKVKNAQLKGAIGVIVANHAAGGDSLMTMGGTDATVTIPSVFVGHTSGATIKAAAGTSSTIRLTTPAPLQRDGDLDGDIVWHEYGHGLDLAHDRQHGRPVVGCDRRGHGRRARRPLNGDDRVGEYSSSNPTGIRSAPYTNHPRTYGSVTGANGVHYDGEVYGAIGWKLRELYLAAGLTETDVLRDLVQGMRFTPAGPSYQQMRDGILAGTASTTAWSGRRSRSTASDRARVVGQRHDRDGQVVRDPGGRLPVIEESSLRVNKSSRGRLRLLDDLTARRLVDFVDRRKQ